MKNFGFTLAEVLITLAVIGVVAAMTIPSLIKNYQKHAWVNALKENYSLLNQGFQKMIADDGVEFISDTEVFKSIGESSCHYSNISSVNCKGFLTQFEKYFKVVSVESIVGKYKYRYRNYNTENTVNSPMPGARNVAIYLSNGVIIWEFRFNKNPTIVSQCDAIHAAGGHMCGNAGGFYIDINGNKKPNEFGKDIFYFYITERGQLAPYGGNDYAIWIARTNLTQENIDKYKANGGYIAYCDNTSRYGAGAPPGLSCAGLLIEQLNWKMDY